MGAFQNKKYVSSAEANGIAARYRAALAKRPFLLFGLPFMAIIVAGSFVLTPATAIRYEKHDRKVRQMTREEELGVGNQRRKVDIKDEYYVSSGWAISPIGGVASADVAFVSTETRREGPRRLGAATSEATPRRERRRAVDWNKSKRVRSARHLAVLQNELSIK